jgi:cyclophilin family peptidyl-prolyl cis-trans isomerase
MRIARLLVLAALALAVAGCGGGDDEPAAEGATTDGEGCVTSDQPEPKEDGGATAPEEQLDPGTTYALVVETNCGSFTITLDQRSAPATTASLVALARAGFFDDTSFHRVVPGFVIQGGDPTGTGTGGPGYKTVDPPAQDTAYTRGVVAMAKAGNEAPGTSGSQFFVVTGADAGLPPDYAVVGTVTAGLDAVLEIDGLGVGDGPPSMPVVIDQVTVQES